MGITNDAGMDRIHLPDWRRVPRTMHFHILLAYLNGGYLRHVVRYRWWTLSGFIDGAEAVYATVLG